MAKLAKTYKNLPYFAVQVGDLLTDEQIFVMLSTGQWDQAFNYGSMLAIDFTDHNDVRSDWLALNGVDFCRALCVKTFANGGSFWLVVKTSY